MKTDIMVSNHALCVLFYRANKYSESTSTRKQKKAGEYGYMAGQMMQEHAIDDPKYSQYMTAAQQGEQHGMNTEMLNDFRSGARTQQRKERREQNGRYDSRPEGGNAAQGKKAEDGSMFHFFDSDTSSSSGEE
jgi:hypothetical protein